MSGGGTNTGYNISGLSGLWNQSNTNFQPLPYGNTTNAANNAYNLTSGAAGQGPSSYYNSAGVGQNVNNSDYLGYTAQGQSFGQDYQNPNYLGKTAQNNSFSNQTYQNPITQGQNQYNALSPYVSQIMNQAFDPQQALFNQQFQLQQDQGNAANAMAGVANTPYGAGLAQQGNQNFDIAWQNNQLQREATGASAASGLSGQAMNDLTSGINTGVGSASTLGGLANAGYSTAVGNATNLGNLANSGYTTGANIGNQLYSEGTQTTQNQLQDYLNYLGSSQANAVDWTNAVLGSQNAQTSLYGAQNSAAYGNQSLQNQSISGLGSLLGLGAGYGLSSLSSALPASGAIF